MGSLRNPVGPLPSNIYWRRRAILLSLAAVLALLIIWMVSTSGGGGNGDKTNDSGDKNPVASITPGPSGSGPAISEKPGGRDESGSGGSGGTQSPGATDGTDGGEGSGGSSGSGGDSSGGTGGGDGADGSGDGEGTGGTGGAGSGQRLPAGSSLPNCTSAAVKLTLRSVENTYAPGQTPKLRLIAENSSDVDCKLDLGAERAVVTITQSEGDKDVWASDHCAKDSKSLLLRVPANDSATRTLEWNRKQSAPECATAPAGSAAPGTYLVEAEAPGLATARTSFVLRKD
ncbi:hypothetical protein [Streptomyces sp. NPDC005955]|uniref:hypothetical protein n=1 Tax=Streptomyces sp. NPDC005955 TaxID=3364738 RepID=UPI0036C1DB1E